MMVTANKQKDDGDLLLMWGGGITFHSSRQYVSDSMRQLHSA